MVRKIGHYIGGRQVPGAAARTVASFNPATGEQSGEVACEDEIVLHGNAGVADQAGACGRGRPAPDRSQEAPPTAGTREKWDLAG